jgi:hypothetical protein
VRINTLQGFLTWSLIAFLCVGSSPLQSVDEPTNVKVVSERVERVSRDEVHFWLKVVNGSPRPVFVTGINYEKPTPYPLFLEQWRAEEGWKAVAPCMDLAPPDVINLKPSEAISLEFVLTLPHSGCKERNIQLEGRFRYRLEYFESEKEARTYVKETYSPGHQPARAAVAVSEPFEIPPPKK